MKQAAWMGVILAALALLGCGGPTLLQGKITDESGAIVERAEVQTEPSTDLILSNTHGMFAIRHKMDDRLGDKAEPITPGAYVLKVIKDGYEPFELKLEVKSGLNKLAPIVLKEKKLNIGDAAPDAMKEIQVTHGETSTPVPGQ